MRKYMVIVPDGAADYPLEELEGKTPLEAAFTPNMDFIAKNGVCGTALTIPSGMAAGSDVANFSLLGYDPRIYYTGRGPLEAASLGVELEEGEFAFRCNLITVDGGRLVDYSADHITTEEARILVQELSKELSGDGIDFYPGMSYRHILKLRGDFHHTNCQPPHDVTGYPLEEVFPSGPGSDTLLQLIHRSWEVLRDHPINQKRLLEGRRPANSIWPWGQGRSPQLPTLQERYGITGAVITAVDLIKGLGLYAGMRVEEVPGATGYYNTDYAAKALYGIKDLYHYDLVFIHIEAPDEAGHEGDVEQKIKALEEIDKKIVGALLNEISRISEDFRILVAPDHLTPIPVRTHVPAPVPFALYWLDIRPDRGHAFSEKGVEMGSYHQIEGWKLLDILVKS